MWDPRGEIGGGNTENTERPCAPHTGQAIPNVLRSLDLLPGSGAGPWGGAGARASRLGQRELLQAPFPSRYLARSFLVTNPTT